jgi:hypothetical protein
MPINKNYILMCDEVRQEVNGKLFIIGLYTPDISVSQLPAALKLTFFMNLHSDRPGNFGFRLKLEHLDSGAPIAEGMGVLPFAQPGDGICPFPIVAQFTSAGSYVLSLEIDGQPNDPITSQFQIILNVPGISPAGMPGMQQSRLGR